MQMRRTTLCSLVTSYSLLHCNLGNEGLLVIWLLASCSWFDYKTTNMCVRDVLRKLCVHHNPCGCGGVLSKLEEKAMERHTTILMATIATWCRVAYYAFPYELKREFGISNFSSLIFFLHGLRRGSLRNFRKEGSLFDESGPTNTPWLRKNTPTHLVCTSSVQLSEACKWLR